MFVFLFLQNSSQYRVSVDRPTLIRMLLEGLSFLEDFEQYIVWAEQGLDESANVYLSACNEGLTNCRVEEWSKVIDMILLQVNEILSQKRATFEQLKRHNLARLAENLVLICSHQLEASETGGKMLVNSPVSWILLHRAIEFEESRLSTLKCSKSTGEEEKETVDATEEEGLPCSILFLLSAHDLLGKRSWCLLQEGMFVTYLFEASTCLEVNHLHSG